MSDIELVHIREGDGTPPIVFVHGYLCEHRNWRHQVDQFKATNTVVACDLRGLGNSPLGEKEMSIETLGRDVADLGAAEDLHGAVLVGHSMGCRVIMEASRHAGGRVAGLVLVDGSRSGQDRDADQARFDASVAEAGFPAVAGALFEGMFFGDPPDWKATALDAAASVPESIARPLYRNLIAWDADHLEPTLAGLDMPVLILQSTYMNMARQRVRLEADEKSPYQDLITERVSDVTSLTLAGPGHFNMIESPESVNAAIADFLAAKFG